MITANPIKGYGELGAEFSQLLCAMSNALKEFGFQHFLFPEHILHQVVDVHANSVPTRYQVMILNT